MDDQWLKPLDYEGTTLLHAASEFVHDSLLHLLLPYYAELQTKCVDVKGKSPIHRLVLCPYVLRVFGEERVKRSLKAFSLDWFGMLDASGATVLLAVWKQAVKKGSEACDTATRLSELTCECLRMTPALQSFLALPDAQGVTLSSLLSQSDVMKSGRYEFLFRNVM